MIGAFLLAFSAQAEIPPPDYRSEIMGAAAEEVARLAREEGFDAAKAFAKKWRRQVGDDARIAYELGLAARLAGDEKGARSWLDDAIAADPTLVAARYDRGEVLLNAGDLDAAEADFREVVRLAPTQWAGHFRLADIAARRGDADGFETHLLDALRQGFSLKTVTEDPRWHGYFADPALGPVIRRLVTVYDDESILDTLAKPASP
jgi:tetratricopeptide (TPR) repeat protein